MTVNPAVLLLADGRLPAGGHVHSAGLEAAVAIGDVRDVESLDRYLGARLATTGRVDAAFAGAAARAAHSLDDADRDDTLDRLTHEYDARTPSPYLRSTSRRLGRQLMRVAATTWPSPAVAAHAANDIHQPIALGLVTAAAGGTAADAATVAVHHLASAVASAGTRLLGLDPVRLTGVQAARTAEAVGVIVTDSPWDVDDPSMLPATGGSLTEILGEHHGSLDARLFAT